ncbi:uncharacterized protein LOC106872118 [Octopus bimaculoides]|uniref:uncharacterized protein LOC106872118 n=1 Tax=Octopus bimaculoides TaxID=37653 RepID=UPI00071C58B7|nr:uncharacterized protein LOC106872118 [Octopus bimaculoides]|eukprot:XP_014774470.1 PREDICTED: uncharacterized protein LOC106872118 [Octopus bimaculoides]
MSSHMLPQFTGDAILWFAQLEAHFDAYGISPTNQLKFLYCSLSTTLATSARDLITSPNPDTTYAPIKAEILRRTTKFAESRFNELMADEELGDRTPSEFLRHLRVLSGESTDALLLRKIFFSRLPAHVRTILATALDANTIDQVATMADKILEFSAQPAYGACVSSEASSIASHKSSTFDVLADKIDKLTRRVNDLCRTKCSSSCSRDRSRRNSPSKTQPGMCYYHAKFADKAHKCIQPCSYKAS